MSNSTIESAPFKHGSKAWGIRPLKEQSLSSRKNRESEITGKDLPSLLAGASSQKRAQNGSFRELIMVQREGKMAQLGVKDKLEIEKGREVIGQGEGRLLI